MDYINLMWTMGEQLHLSLLPVSALHKTKNTVQHYCFSFMCSCWSCLVLAALTQLQTGQDLTLNGLHPRVPLLHALSFKVPRLARAWHNQEVKVILIWQRNTWKTKSDDESKKNPEIISKMRKRFYLHWKNVKYYGRSILPVLLTFLKLPKLFSFHIFRLAA